MRAHLLLLASLAYPALALAETSVVLFPALGRPGLVAVGGRVTHGAPERDAAPLARNARRLLTESREGIPVAVTFAGQARRVKTGDDGLFEVSFPAPAGSQFAPGLHELRAEAGGATANGRVQVVSDDAPFLVVTDLDDTLAVSHVQSLHRLARAALLEDERTQPVVESTRTASPRS